MKQKKAWSFFQSGEGIYVSHCSAKCMWHDARAGSGLASDDMAKLIPFLAIPIIKTILDFIVSLGLFAILLIYLYCLR